MFSYGKMRGCFGVLASFSGIWLRIVFDQMFNLASEVSSRICCALLEWPVLPHPSMDIFSPKQGFGDERI